jgi:hypothetical protein
VQRAAFLLIAAVLVLPEAGLRAEPPAKPERIPSSTVKTTDRGPTRGQLLESANGWFYLKGEWLHPDGYKFTNNKVIRTTARTGRAFPKPPGKLALENPTKLAPPAKSTVAPSRDEAKTPAQKEAEARRKNLTPTAAPQTGTHL